MESLFARFKQIKFFGGNFRLYLLLFIFVELLSFTVHWLSIAVDISFFVYVALMLFTLLLTLKNLRYGFYVALGELFIGSQGHLFDLRINDFTISIRMGIFAIVMSACFFHLLKSEQRAKIFNFFREFKSLLIFAGFVALGLVLAFVYDNSPAMIYADFNAWLYFAYFIPAVLVLAEIKYFNRVLQIFTASITAIALKTLIFVYVFSHQMPLMRDLYDWGRDTRWGEFTQMDGGFFRIFSQAQIFALLGFLLIFCYLALKGLRNYRTSQNKSLNLIMIILLAIIIVSLSRSFWVALAGGFLLILPAMIFIYKFNFSKLLILFGRLMFLTLSAYLLIILIINIPLLNYSGELRGGTDISKRINIDGVAVSSRWSQLPELWPAINNHLLFGSGWGRTITYQSQDPRILNEYNPEGYYTTYAFEWGYLDLILKIGLFGMASYLIFLFSLFYRLMNLWKKNKDHYFRALCFGLFIALASLLLTHGFSPYLNHPLGIGFVIIVAVFVFRFKQENLFQN